MSDTNAKRGLDIIISIGDNVLGGQRGATLNRSSETIDITNKVSGGWTEKIASVKDWSVDCDGIFVVDDEALDAIETAVLSSTVVNVKIADANWGYKGKAIITDFPIEAAYDDAATYSLTLEGTGALEKVVSETVIPSTQE
jgi:TP901-1 family phage major tail protein